MPACTASADTPGYSAASVISPVVPFASRIALSVMTFTGPLPGIPSSRRAAPRLRWPGLVMKSTCSGNPRGLSFATMSVRCACTAISAAPPDPGNRTVGRSYDPMTVVLMLP